MDLVAFTEEIPGKLHILHILSSDSTRSELVVCECNILRQCSRQEVTQLTFSCSKSPMKTLEKGVKYVQSQQ